ncbi:hypothetical protein DFP72DRAFT_909541 [Ephemerocybe angulata]|uniref:Uncharacterized protein n=1 Tax=Ephemerocybe angulata TaxID=980116 RepID=A0A8H6HPL5_9AGAR|nr:hypothetical protein DFP72DRAFT_909541 [Tulosesus angulatus]
MTTCIALYPVWSWLGCSPQRQTGLPNGFGHELHELHLQSEEQRSQVSSSPCFLRNDASVSRRQKTLQPRFSNAGDLPEDKEDEPDILDIDEADWVFGFSPLAYATFLLHLPLSTSCWSQARTLT